MFTHAGQSEQAATRKSRRRFLQRLSRQMLRRAALSLAAATGPAILALFNWWIHTH